MQLTGTQQGYKAVARYMLAMAIHDAKAGVEDFDCPEEEPKTFLNSPWAELICNIAEIDRQDVLGLLPKDPPKPVETRGKATLFIELSPASRRFSNVVLGYQAAARIIGCDPSVVYRALKAGRTQVNGWSVRYKEQRHDR
ncbi:MAG: hypothetical protein EOM68_26095 [Spirochaetia bacterium]|nr:hypothetical protein [Spirochaetia bacterium]